MVRPAEPNLLEKGITDAEFLKRLENTLNISGSIKMQVQSLINKLQDPYYEQCQRIFNAKTN